jgi:hypothetical protein
MQIENILRLRAGEPLEKYIKNVQVVPGPWGCSVEEALKAYEKEAGVPARVYFQSGSVLWVIGEDFREAPEAQLDPGAVKRVWTGSNAGWPSGPHRMQ